VQVASPAESGLIRCAVFTMLLLCLLHLLLNSIVKAWQ
jgi:hypothetical protein